MDDWPEDFLTLIREIDVVPHLVLDEESVLTSQELLGEAGLLIAVGQAEYRAPSATTVLVEPDDAVLEDRGLLVEDRPRVEVEAVFPLAGGRQVHEVAFCAPTRWPLPGKGRR